MNFTTFRSTMLAALSALFLASTALAGAPGYTITTHVDPAQSGAVSLSSSPPYQKNNIVIVTAVANSGYVFDHWGGSLSGSTNPATLRVGGNATITAHFKPTAPGPGPDPLPSSQLIVGYFAQWAIYQRAYLPKHIKESGAADALNVINYAFAAPDATLPKCASLDTYADYGKACSAAESVDGSADTSSQPLKGNFNQLKKLKALYPNMRVLLSLGGWTQSSRFSDIAASDTSRKAFAASCIDMFIKGNVASGVNAAGVFDGFDIDWEYPGSCGATCAYRPEDGDNFPALLAEFRSQLNALEDKVETDTGKRPEYLLTIAAPAGAIHYQPIHLQAAQASLDWINLMAYDFHGAWEPTGPANHHAALYSAGCQPTDTDRGDTAVRAYLDAGVLPSKLLLGAPFYGHGWRGVAAVDYGLCQPATGVPRGKYEKGVNDFKVLDAQARTDFYDASKTAHWTFNGSEFWSYDDEESLGNKADYVNGQNLRGVMFWELSGDAADGTLVKALRNRLGPTN